MRLALLFGGKSAEHDVSIASAKNFAGNIDQGLWELSWVYIDRSGLWWLFDSWEAFERRVGQVPINLFSSDKGGLMDARSGCHVATIDLAIPMLHGPYGEDGSVQGYLECCNIPYLGSGVAASALCMDKELTKIVLMQSGYETPKFVRHLVSDQTPPYVDVAAKLGGEFFVKPARLGSSIGISRVADANGYNDAVLMASEYDRKVIFEEAIDGRELECGVLELDRLYVGAVGEIEYGSVFYDYQTKYGDPTAVEITVPAEISTAMVQEVQQKTLSIFRLLGCAGLARVDFFLTDGRLFVNEINTMPGFTRMSMFPRLWQQQFSQSEVINGLIQASLREPVPSSVEDRS